MSQQDLKNIINLKAGWQGRRQYEGRAKAIVRLD